MTVYQRFENLFSGTTAKEAVILGLNEPLRFPGQAVTIRLANDFEKKGPLCAFNSKAVIGILITPRDKLPDFNIPIGVFGTDDFKDAQPVVDQGGDYPALTVQSAYVTARTDYTSYTWTSPPIFVCLKKVSIEFLATFLTHELELNSAFAIDIAERAMELWQESQKE